MKIFRCSQILITLLLVFFVISCGYKLGKPKTYFEGNNGKLTKIAVPMFENDSMLFSAEVEFTNSMRKKIAEDSRFILADSDESDFILYGKIAEIKDEIAAMRMEQTGHRAGILEIRAKVLFRLVDKSGFEFWHSTIDETTTYHATGNSYTMTENRREIMQRLSDEITRLGLIEMTERF